MCNKSEEQIKALLVKFLVEAYSGLSKSGKNRVKRILIKTEK